MYLPGGLRTGHLERECRVERERQGSTHGQQGRRVGTGLNLNGASRLRGPAASAPRWVGPARGTGNHDGSGRAGGGRVGGRPASGVPQRGGGGGGGGAQAQKAGGRPPRAHLEYDGGLRNQGDFDAADVVAHHAG